MRQEERWIQLAKESPDCPLCGASDGEPCRTPSGNVAYHAARSSLRSQQQAERDRLTREAEERAESLFQETKPSINTATCGAEMHNISNGNVWRHNCTLPQGHEEPYHACGQHNLKTREGCLWRIGAFQSV